MEREFQGGFVDLKEKDPSSVAKKVGVYATNGVGSRISDLLRGQRSMVSRMLDGARDWGFTRGRSCSGSCDPQTPHPSVHNYRLGQIQGLLVIDGDRQGSRLLQE